MPYPTPETNEQLTPEYGWVGSDFGGVTASWAKFLGGLNLLVTLSKSVGKNAEKTNPIKHMVFIGDISFGLQGLHR